jgi:hypothetical protein
MASYTIYIPNNDSTLSIDAGDEIVITFRTKAEFVPSDEHEFYDEARNRYITHGVYKAGDVLRGTAQTDEEFAYSFNEVSDKNSTTLLQSGMRTIIVGSHFDFDVELLERTLKEDEHLSNTFCDCWPCTERLLRLLLDKLPIPAGLKKLLEHFVDIGHKAYEKLCKNK